MIFTDTGLPGAMLIRMERHEDSRGHFARTFCEREFARHGLPVRWVQSSIAVTREPGTLRGLHFQAPPHAEDKLVCCVRGAIWDAIVDLRPDSPTYCRWFGTELNESNGRLLLVPKGFAHGYVTLRADTAVVYQMSAFYEPAAARGVRYDDPAFGIEWPVAIEHLSERDRSWPAYVPETAGSAA